MQTSESIKNLAAALVTFHTAVGKIAKDATNPFFNKAYCSLPNILETINKPLNEAGLSIVQFPEGANELTTRLMHSSGEWMQATYNMPVSKQNDPQSLGSAISYQRRYSIMSVLCLTIADDDDANLATHGASTPQQAAKQAAKFVVQNGTEGTEKPWLNRYTDKSQSAETPEYGKVLKALVEGKATITDVEKKYRLNKEIREELKGFERKAQTA